MISLHFIQPTPVWLIHRKSNGLAQGTLVGWASEDEYPVASPIVCRDGKAEVDHLNQIFFSFDEALWARKDAVACQKACS